MAARKLRERIEELTVVADIASAMLSPLELTQVMDVALAKVCRATGAPSGAITLLSPDKTRLEFAAVYGLSAGYGEKFREIGLLPADGSSPSGRAVSTGKPYWVADITRHLVSNAVKFTARRNIQVSGCRDRSMPHHARIEVSDTGIGLRPDQVPLLFEEFHQLPGPYQHLGTGLGLAISRKLARLMGGDIEVESDYGRGATFTLKLETA